MKPRELRDSGQGDLLRSRLDAILDMDHQLVVLARKVDWGFLEERLGEAYRARPGQPPLPTRLTAVLTILKYTYDLSDEELCARWLYYEGTRSDGVHFTDRGVSFHSTHGPMSASTCQSPKAASPLSAKPSHQPNGRFRISFTTSGTIGVHPKPTFVGCQPSTAEAEPIAFRHRGRLKSLNVRPFHTSLHLGAARQALPPDHAGGEHAAILQCLPHGSG